MFWGLILKANKKYSQTVQKAFHLSQAALDLSKSSDDDVQVMLTSEDNTYLLCTLGKKTPQVALDLNFDEGDHISLSTKGEGIVHLTGYLVPIEDDLFDNFEDDLEAEEEEVEVEVPQQKGKGGKQERVAKKVALKVNAKEVQQEPDEDDEMDETFELPKDAKKKAAAGADADDSDDESDEDDDDEDDDDDELDDSKAAEEDSDDDDDDDDDEEDDEDDDDEEDDDDDESEDEQPKAKVPKMDKKQQQQGKQNGLENGKASSKELKKDEKAATQKDEPKTRTLQGGLVVEDIKVGNGAEAKPGKKVAVYYEGRLKKNNKVFDSTAKGPGFKFALGRGEVIKGWDVGVAGMKVGGKRRLTVPHQLAYGTRGSPPVIPPNSTLVFDVELKNVF